MRRYLLIIIAMLPTLVALSQADSGAKTIVDKALARVKKAAMELSFTMTVENAQLGVTEQEKGTLSLKGDMFVLKMGGVETYFDGKTQWVYMPENQEVSLSSPSHEELKETNPIKGIEGYDKSHKVTLNQSSDGDASFFHIDLYPNDRKCDYFRLSILIEKKSYKLSQMQFSFKNGLELTFKLSNLKNVELNTSYFRFEPSNYPGVEINDLR